MNNAVAKEGGGGDRSEVDFCFVIEPNRPCGTDLFNLARQGGRWIIVHKSYWL